MGRAEYGTPAISDALDSLQIDGVVDGLQRLTGSGGIGGSALVAVVEDGHSDKLEGLADILAAVQRDTVLVLAWQTTTVASTLGDLAGGRLEERGAVAVVSEGYVRDVDVLRRSGLSIWARGVTPRSGRGRLVLRLRERVNLANGIVVRSGDLVFGDETGVCVVPRQKAKRVLARAKDNEVQDASVSAGMQAPKAW